MIDRSMKTENSLKALADRLVPISKRELLVAYKSWAPVYDWTFGLVARAGRNAAVNRANRLGGQLLEVGVGTGLTLPRYSSRVQVVGMDLSPHMLKQAQTRVENDNINNVIGLSLMDAGHMAYADNSFDIVTAMYVMTVAPDPRAVFDELCRVVRPGGEIILVNHFSHDKGWRARLERLFAPHAAWLGWRPRFPLAPFIDTPGLTLTNSRELSPLGMFTMLCFRKDEATAETGAELGQAPEEREQVPAIEPVEGTGHPIPAAREAGGPAGREVGGLVTALSSESTT